MIVPSLECPASCRYCFGPNLGQTMSEETAGQTIDFIRRVDQQAGLKKIHVTFHGGEPLVVGHEFFECFLNQLKRSFSGRPIDLGIQSNLWLLDDTFCAIFKEHNVSVGTSLDGPEAINDLQRGVGYFKKTMAGIQRARAWGLDVGCIATFTRDSWPHWRDIANFFIGERLSFSVHASVPAWQQPDSGYALSPDEKAALLPELLDFYILNRKKLSISTFDQMAKGILAGQGQICTFKDCLGMFLAIDPTGNIYPCQRFCGHPDFRLATLDDRPSLESLYQSPIAVRMKERERQIAQACRACDHVDYCKGGCSYNAWAGGNGSPKDPYCPAYQQIFTKLRDRLVREMGSEENIAAVADRPYGKGGDLLLKRGPLIEIVRSGPHPSLIARNARRIVAAVELAKGPDIPTVADRLIAWGICRNRDTAQASLEHLKRSLAPEASRLNNLYLHLTFACQLHCTHCYAGAGTDESGELSPGHLADLIGQARRAGFRQVILTGGEPLLHSQRDELLAILDQIRSDASPMKLVLRTNLAMPLDENVLRRIAAAFHQAVVSIDGSRQTHDERRGAGSYDASVTNMKRYQSLAETLPGAAELSIAAVLRSSEIDGEPGRAVSELARRLGVRRIRFRPLLPLGRAADWDEPPQSEALGAYLDPMDLIEGGFAPVAGCGMGQNLYVEPSGDAFPCYAFHRPQAMLGNVIRQGLSAVTGCERFRTLARHTVDTNPTCRRCDYRYLCGGACRAWGGEPAQQDLDAPVRECAGLRQRAIRLFEAACDYLDIGDGDPRSPIPGAV